MITRRILITGAGGFAAAAILGAQGRGSSKAVFKHELPDLTMKGWSVTAVEVSYGPGDASASHSHPGITIAYVLEGEIRSKVGMGRSRLTRWGKCSWRHRINSMLSRETPAQPSRRNCWRSC